MVHGGPIKRSILSPSSPGRSNQYWPIASIFIHSALSSRVLKMKKSVFALSLVASLVAAGASDAATAPQVPKVSTEKVHLDKTMEAINLRGSEDGVYDVHKIDDNDGVIDDIHEAEGEANLDFKKLQEEISVYKNNESVRKKTAVRKMEEKVQELDTSKVSPAGGAAAATSTAAPVGEKKPDMIEPVAATAATSTTTTSATPAGGAGVVEELDTSKVSPAGGSAAATPKTTNISGSISPSEESNLDSIDPVGGFRSKESSSGSSTSETGIISDFDSMKGHAELQGERGKKKRERGERGGQRKGKHGSRGKGGSDEANDEGSHESAPSSSSSLSSPHELPTAQSQPQEGAKPSALISPSKPEEIKEDSPTLSESAKTQTQPQTRESQSSSASSKSEDVDSFTRTESQAVVKKDDADADGVDDDADSWGPGGSMASFAFSAGVLIVLVFGFGVFLVKTFGCCDGSTKPVSSQDEEEKRPLTRHGSDIEQGGASDDGNVDWSDDEKWGDDSRIEESSLKLGGSRDSQGAASLRSRGSSISSAGGDDYSRQSTTSMTSKGSKGGGTFSIRGSSPSQGVSTNVSSSVAIKKGSASTPEQQPKRTRGGSASQGQNVDLFAAMGVEASPSFNNRADSSILGNEPSSQTSRMYHSKINEGDDMWNDDDDYLNDLSD